MKILIHRKGRVLLKVISDSGETAIPEGTSLSGMFWLLSTQYPDDLIGWCEEKFEPVLKIANWDRIFHHDLIMASYGIESYFLPPSIGYIDTMPFINFPKNITYGTWRMSSDVGGIRGKTLSEFKSLFENEKDFSFLINSIGKVGQQNGLFCYNEPQLVSVNAIETKSTGTTSDLFSFTYSHYNWIWSPLLLFFFIWFEKRFPWYAFIKSVFRKRYFKKDISLARIAVTSNRSWNSDASVDVIIPTMGRPEYLLQVIDDLQNQTLLPRKVIVVEQNPDEGTISELRELKARNLPFETIHHFTHQAGVCNARNIALEETSSEWVFLADDDNRIAPDFLERALSEIKRYGIDMVTTYYPQKGEVRKFNKVKQWGTFGAGNSIVSSKFIKKVKFDTAFEYGYGEDKDFGMRLRLSGCDIIYHPELEILHLKAPVGGFRYKSVVPWEKEEGLEPKPSPTLMVYVKRYFSEEQENGFKMTLFLRNYFNQKERNPFSYLKHMRKRWLSSEEWAEFLLSKRQ